MGVHEPERLLEIVAQCGADRVVLFGWSLGAGVSIAAAARGDARIAGVIAEAPYRRAIDPARAVMAAAGLPHTLNLPPAMASLGIRHGVGPGWRGFDRAELAAKVTTPLLVIHGEVDPVCDPADGQAIAEAAPHGRYVEIPGGTHNGLWTDADTLGVCQAAVDTFFSGLPRPSSPQTASAD